METNINPISFRLTKIKTDQFATLEDVFDSNKPVEVVTDAQYGANVDLKTIFCKLSHNFKNTGGSPFIKIDLTCIFEIEPSDWDKLYSINRGSLKLPRDLCIHMAMLTIGTARGVLHSKTEGTSFNSQILPTINTLEMITSDLLINFS